MRRKQIISAMLHESSPASVFALNFCWESQLFPHFKIQTFEPLKMRKGGGSFACPLCQPLSKLVSMPKFGHKNGPSIETTRSKCTCFALQHCALWFFFSFLVIFIEYEQHLANVDLVVSLWTMKNAWTGPLLPLMHLFLASIFAILIISVHTRKLRQWNWTKPRKKPIKSDLDLSVSGHFIQNDALVGFAQRKKFLTLAWASLYRFGHWRMGSKERKRRLWFIVNACFDWWVWRIHCTTPVQTTPEPCRGERKSQKVVAWSWSDFRSVKNACMWECSSCWLWKRSEHRYTHTHTLTGIEASVGVFSLELICIFYIFPAFSFLFLLIQGHRFTSRYTGQVWGSIQPREKKKREEGKVWLGLNPSRIIC